MTDREYILVRQRVGRGPNDYVLVLKRRSEEVTFIEDLSSDYRKKDEAARIVTCAVRLARNGTDWAIRSGTLKLLDNGLAIYELKSKRTVYRVMTYVHDDKAKTPVLLFAFHGHQRRGGGGILREDEKRAARLARIARALVKEEARE